MNYYYYGEKIVKRIGKTLIGDIEISGILNMETKSENLEINLEDLEDE